MGARNTSNHTRPKNRRLSRAAARPAAAEAEARKGRKREAAARRSAWRKLLKAGTLLAELTPTKSKSRNTPPLPTWALNPKDSSLVIEWAGASQPAGPGHPRILTAPAYTTETRYPRSAPVRLANAQFSPSGRFLAFACGSPYNTLTVWEWPEREVCRLSLSVPDAIEFDATEEFLFCATSSGACVVSLASAETISQVTFERRGVASAIAPSGDFAVFGTEASELIICEFPSLRELKTLATRKRPVKPPKTRQELVALLKTHDMNELAAAMNPERFNTLKFSHDGTWLFAGTQFGMRAWKWQALKETREVKGCRAPAPVHQSPDHPADRPGQNQCHALAYDDFNARLLSAGSDGAVRYLDLETETIGVFLRPPELLPISHLALSGDQRALVVQSGGSNSKTDHAPQVRVWNYAALCWLAGLKVRSRHGHLFGPRRGDEIG
jgi:WD40 repeat protein